MILYIVWEEGSSVEKRPFAADDVATIGKSSELFGIP